MVNHISDVVQLELDKGPRAPISSATSERPPNDSDAPQRSAPSSRPADDGLGHCDFCGGYRFVRVDVPLTDPRFGKLLPCPMCGPRLKRDVHERTFSSKRERLERYSQLRRDRTFAGFGLGGANNQIRAAYVAAKSFAAEPRGWLVLHGNCGTGKSHLANAIANALEGWLTLSMTMPNLLDMLRSGYDNGDYNELMDLAVTCDLLVLDDIGTEKQSDWTYEKVFQIIDDRYNAMRPSVFVTNLDPRDLDMRVSSRLLDRRVSQVLPMYGDDYRQKERP